MTAQVSRTADKIALAPKNGDAKPVANHQNYYRTQQAADYLGIGKSTLERMRVAGSGPVWRRLGSRTVVYLVADLDNWAGEQVHQSTSEAA